ncbi:MAG: threonine synthase [Bacteroidales bacterium]|jgi:threonine synthase|nr:threonine synthase [Bacteroidales bacterium]
MSGKFHFKCVNCKAEYAGDKVIYLCPVCERNNLPGKPPKGVLKTVYNYSRIGRTGSPKTLFQRLKQERFLSLLPLHGFDCWPRLRIGDTPLYRMDELVSWRDGELVSRQGEMEVYLKDDSQNPTFSFKDRATALVSAWAAEQGIRTIITASTGNAGSSLAGICASQQQQSVIFVPNTAPLAKLTQIVMYGARIIPVKGNYDQAFDLSIKASELFGFYNRNTAYNPFTIEGKKSVAFEIYDQLGGRLPDRIFVPVGDGVILSGLYKGFEDLMNVGIIDRMPVLVAVQAEGSRNLIDNLDRESFSSTASNTIADSISVDVPRNFYMTAHYLDQYSGECVSVTDDEIVQSSFLLGRTTGIFSEPAAVAAYAGMVKYRKEGKLQRGSKNVVLLTGSGLKDLKSVQSSINLPEPFDPDTGMLEKLFPEKQQ